MGMLDTDMGSDAAEPAETDAAPTEQQALETADTTPVVPEAEKRERVQLPPTSRRGRAERRDADYQDKLRSVEETVKKAQDEYRAELSRRDAEIARLRGSYEALQPLIQQQQQARQAAEPTADDLDRQADAALDQGQYSEYRRLLREASDVRTEQKIAALRKELAPQQQQGTNPVIGAMLASSKAVLSAGERGMALVRIKDAELGVMGYQDNPDRWQRAFQMAEAQLGAANTSNGYTQQAAGALAAVPTSRASGTKSSRGPGVELSDLEKDWARRAGMSNEEYAQELASAHPDRVTT
jgi:hypothetical protein